MLDPIKLEHFRNLISITGADGKIEDLELVALSKIAFEHGIPLDRLHVMLKHADEYMYLIPQNLEERDDQMQQMINIALVDGEFAKAELELVMKVGAKLGFSQQELDQMLAGHIK